MATVKTVGAYTRSGERVTLRDLNKTAVRMNDLSGRAFRIRGTNKYAALVEILPGGERAVDRSHSLAPRALMALMEMWIDGFTCGEGASC